MSTAHEPTPGPVVDVAPRPASVKKNLRGGNEAAARAAANRVEVPDTASEDSKIAASAAKEWRHHQEEHGARPTTEAWQKITEIPDSKPVIDSIADVDAKNKAIAVNDALRNLMSANAEGLNQNLDATYVQIIQPLQEIMLQAPGFAELAKEMGDGPALTDDQKKEWVKFLTEQIDAGRATGDNRFADKLKEKYTEFIKKERKPAGLDQQQKAAEDRLKILGKQQDRANTRYSQISNPDGLIDKNRDLKLRYESGDKADALVAAEKAVVDGEGEFSKLKNSVSLSEKKRKELIETRTELIRNQGRPQNIDDLNKEIERIDGEISKAQVELKPFEAQIEVRDELLKEKEGLDAAHDKLNAEQKVLEEELMRLGEQITLATAKVNELGHGDTEDIAKGLQEIFKDSFTETMMARLAHDRDGVLDVLSTKIAAETDPHVKVILKQLRESANRWSHWESGKEGRIKGKLGIGEEKQVINKADVERDYKILMERGPEALIDRMLMGPINPGTIDSTHPLGRPYGRKERQALIANKEFMDKVSGPAIAMLLKQAQAEGMLHASDMAKIGDAEWGESALDALAELNKNKEEWAAAKKAAGGFKKFMGDMLSPVNARRGVAAFFALIFVPWLAVPGIGIYSFYKFVKPGEAPKADETKKAHDEHAKPAPPHPSIITAKAAA